MANWIFNPAVVFIVRIFLGLLLFVSGLMKLPELRKFYIIFLQFGVLRGKVAKVAAYTLPFAEIILGMLILAGLMFKLLSGMTVFYFLTITFGVGFAMYKHKKIKDCGCYGIAMKSPVNFGKLVENIVLLMFAVYLFVSTM